MAGRVLSPAQRSAVFLLSQVLSRRKMKFCTSCGCERAGLQHGLKPGALQLGNGTSVPVLPRWQYDSSFIQLFIRAIWCLCDLPCYRHYKWPVRGEAGRFAWSWFTRRKKTPCVTPAISAVFLCFCWTLRMDHHTWTLVRGTQQFRHLKHFLSLSPGLLCQ